MTRARHVVASFHALPIVVLRDIVSGPCVVLAPHPDDESLGCGGLIALAAEAGIDVHVAVLTDGSGSHPGSKRFPPAALARLRADEVREAAALLGVTAKRVHLLGARDTRAPHDGPEFARLVETLAGLLRAAGAQTLFTTWRHDPHGDHVAAHAIARHAAASVGARLRCYSVWGRTLDEQDIGPATGVRLDVTSVLARKRAAIAAHRSQTTDLIDDDPQGFRLTDAFIGMFLGDFEVFLDDG